MLEKLRLFLFYKLKRREEQIIIAFGGLNKEGRDEFLMLCEATYKQVKDAHPHYPDIKPYIISSIAKRFIGIYNKHTPRIRLKTKTR